MFLVFLVLCRDLKSRRVFKIVLLIFDNRHWEVAKCRLVDLRLDCAHWESSERCAHVRWALLGLPTIFLSICQILDTWGLCGILINCRSLLSHAKPTWKPRLLIFFEMLRYRERDLSDTVLPLALLSYHKHLVVLAVHWFVHKLENISNTIN